ncbi:S41 family peptidase [Flaviaesturariibacter amylovorans]|uniref:Tail specific protease domain-containing protein n=1 Tax=Flaviaesturariibacter amylovorans TaxID=1084520 RepID=A0ABP8HVH7_9BACT
MSNKVSLSFTLALMLPIASFAQSVNTKFLIDTTISIMKSVSISTDTVDWTERKNQMLQRTTGGDDSTDLQNAFGFLYQSLNDAHGALRYKNKRYGWSPAMPPVDDSLENEFKKGDFVKTQFLSDKIGYLRIPSMAHEFRDSLVKHLNDSLCYLLNRKIKGLVIDLRLNGGGSMTPMILGVQQLLGEGTVAGFTTNQGRVIVHLTKNGIYYDSSQKLSFKPTCVTDASRLPVVLLTSFETASSGECLLISFVGRPNTLVIGIPTQGMTSALSWMKVSEEARIGVATAYVNDRSGKVYKGALQPDLYINTVNKMNDIQHDPKVLAAVRWLKTQ